MGRRISPADKRLKKHAALVERTARVMGVAEEQAAHRLRIPLQQSLRVNTLRSDVDRAIKQLKAIGWRGEGQQYCAEGFSIDNGYEAVRDSELVRDGVVYIQNKSSWLPVIALDPQPVDEVLDVCAAPGGKTSHIAAHMGGVGRLVANDNSRARLHKLQANMERLGVSAEYSLYDATKLSRFMEPDQFDKILLDAPCSGEGLINLDNPKTLDSWSVAHIRRLAGLQKQLITQAWQLLKPGGTLVYSTCTIAPEENEVVIDYILRRHEDARAVVLPFELEQGVTMWNDRQLHPDVALAGRVFPRDGAEAFFVCKLQKDSSSTIET